MKKTSSKIIVILLVVCLLFALSSCNLFKKGIFADAQISAVGFEDPSVIEVGKGENVKFYMTLMPSGEKLPSGDIDVFVSFGVASRVKSMTYSSVIEGNSFVDFKDAQENGDNFKLSVSSDEFAAYRQIRIIVEYKVTASENLSVVIRSGGKQVKIANAVSLVALPRLVEIEDFAYHYEDCTGLIAEVNEKLETAKNLDRNGQEFNQLMYECLVTYRHIADQSRIARVEYYADLTNDELGDRYFYLANETEKIRTKYNSIIEGTDEEEYAEYLALAEDNNRIDREYQAISNVIASDEVCSLYAQKVANNNAIAQFYGYDDYVEYAYEKVYQRDYTSSEVQQVYHYIKTYVVPAYNSVKQKMTLANSMLTNDEVRVLQSILYGNFFYLDGDFVGGYAASFPQATAEAMLTMFDGAAFFATNDNCYQGAYTSTFLSDGVPFAYFGTEYQRIFTIVHEMGHYYNCLLGENACSSYDLLEVHSQGSEMLLIAFLESKLTENVFNALLYRHLYSMLDTIIRCAVIDQFEQYVYKNDVSPNLFDTVYGNICAEYGIANTGYWRYVTTLHECYYISYSMSAITTVDVLCKALSNYGDAQEKYLRLFTGDEEEFAEKVTVAGLLNPLTQAGYEEVFSTFCE